MSDLTDDQIKNEGLHAFVFVDEVDPQTDFRQAIAQARGLGPARVLFAAEVVGSSLGFIHIRADEDDLPGLQDLIFRELWDLGIRCSHCLEIKTGRQGVKRDTPEIIAISKLRVPRGGIDDLIDALEADDSPVKDTLKGISVVTGEWDVLVQLNGDDFETVKNAVLNDLTRIPGILDSDTLFTDGSYFPEAET
jgi:DNA-binding Lrp family transcriptional regulator